jgi:hypothetical protein
VAIFKPFLCMAIHLYVLHCSKILSPYSADIVFDEFLNLLHFQLTKIESLHAGLFGACGKCSDHVYPTSGERHMNSEGQIWHYNAGRVCACSCTC